MIDVGDKEPTRQEAVAAAEIRIPAGIRQRMLQGEQPKGDPLAAAQMAGIMAAKRTATLLPLCHPLPLEHMVVVCTPILELERICVQASVRATAQTGVEMEALMAAASPS